MPRTLVPYPFQYKINERDNKKHNGAIYSRFHSCCPSTESCNCFSNTSSDRSLLHANRCFRRGPGYFCQFSEFMVGPVTQLASMPSVNQFIFELLCELRVVHHCTTSLILFGGPGVHALSPLQCPSKLLNPLTSANYSPSNHPGLLAPHQYLYLGLETVSSSLKFCDCALIYAAPALQKELSKAFRHSAHPPILSVNLTCLPLTLSPAWSRSTSG